MPRSSRDLSIFPIALRTVEVRAVEDITPHMRRITVGGPDLRAGIHDGHPIPAFRSDGFDDHVKLVLPAADGGFGEVGVQDGERFAWNREALARTRDYTVRRVRGDEFDLDFVVHDGGLAAAWALTAQVGDPLRIAGPKTSAAVNHEVDWHLLIADETALPAVGRWLEEAPAGTRAQVIVEIPDAADRQEIATSAEASITWLIRPEGVAPGYSEQLLEAVEALELPAGRGFAWCAGETLTISPIRRHLRTERGFATEDVEVVGYWRRTSREVGAAASDGEQTPVPDTAPSPADLAHEIHEMGELLPPIVLRVASTLGIPALLAGGTGTLEGLAAGTGIPSRRLLPLLEAFEALELAATVRDGDQDTLRLTALGEVLLEESAQDSLDLDDPANRLELSLTGLLEVLRTGDRPAGGGVPPRQDPALRRALHDRAERRLAYSLQALGATPAIAGARTLALYGDGLVPTAHELLRLDAARRVILLVTPPDRELTAARLAQLPPAQRARVEVQELDPRSPQVPEADALLAQLALDTADGATVSALAAAVRGALVLVSDLADEAAEDDHVAARALTSLTASGVPLRTGAGWSALLHESGFTDVEAGRLGWGFGPSLVTALR